MKTTIRRHGGAVLILLGAGAWIWAGPNPTTPPNPMTPPKNVSANPVWAQIKALDEKEKAETAAIDQQLAPLRAQEKSLSSQIKPLQEQRDSLRTSDDDQRASLMDQVRPGYLSLYNTMKQSLAGVKTQEEQYRQSTQQQYQTFNQQRQQIHQQFEAGVKALQK